MPLSAIRFDVKDKELFEELVTRICEQFNVEVERPYNDGYRIFKLRSGYVLGEFNSDGYNLLYNITQLSEVLRGLTR